MICIYLTVKSAAWFGEARFLGRDLIYAISGLGHQS